MVLSTFKSRAANILRLHTQDRAAPVEMTPRHRVFSVTHQGWVPADALKPGDEVKTRRGTARVAALSAVEQAVPVFNIEVERQHCYFVSGAEILVHNATPCAPNSKPTGGGRSQRAKSDFERDLKNDPDYGTYSTQNEPYSHLPERGKVAPGRRYSESQRGAILEENMRQNGGRTVSDQSGVEVPEGRAHIDHHHPRIRGGENSNANARVLLDTENLRKGSK